LNILTQSEGTGLVLGGFFSFAFAAGALGEVLGAGVEEAAGAVGFEPHPPVNSAIAPKSNRILFIDSPERKCI
jgi:hypothetical protein